MTVVRSERTWREPLVLALLAFVVLLTRLLALSSSPWEWDEVLFVLAVDEYDIAQHRPHPPGYPLFVAPAKVVHLFVQDEFAAIRTVTLAGAALLPFGLWHLLRSLGLSTFVRVAAVLLVSFTPVIWFYGGTAFSDVPALSLTIFAAASLQRQPRSWLIDVGSALLIAGAIGIRPQNVLIILPFVIAAIWRSEKRRRSMLLIPVIGIAATGVIYAVALAASGSMDRAIDSIVHQAGYVVEVDSIGSPTRPPMDEVWEEFLLDPFPTDVVAWGMYGLALLGALYGLKRYRGAVVILLCSFLPIALLSLMALAHEAAERYSISYIPVVGVLAAIGIEAASARVSGAGRRGVGQSGLLALCVLSLGWRSWKAIEVPRDSASPPFAAVQYVLSKADHDDVIAMDGSLGPFAAAYLPRAELVEEYSGGWVDGYLIEVGPTVLDVPHFRFEQETLRRFARRRYFDVWVAELDLLPRFGSGWYGIEWDGKSRTSFRWMSGSGTIEVPAGSETRCASLRFELPERIDSAGLTAEVEGGEASVVREGDEVSVRVRLMACDGCPRELRLEAEPFVPSDFGSDDRRELGALLRSISVDDCG